MELFVFEVISVTEIVGEKLAVIKFKPGVLGIRDIKNIKDFSITLDKREALIIIEGLVNALNLELKDDKYEF